AELVLEEHALDRELDDALGMQLLHSLVGVEVAAAGVAGVGVVLDNVGLAAGDFDLVGVMDDDEVAGVDVGGVGGLVLALEDDGEARGEAAEDLVGGVNDPPIGFDLAGLGHVGGGGGSGGAHGRTSWIG